MTRTRQERETEKQIRRLILDNAWHPPFDGRPFDGTIYDLRDRPVLVSREVVSVMWRMLYYFGCEPRGSTRDGRSERLAA